MPHLSYHTEIGQRSYQEDRYLICDYDLDVEQGKGTLLAVMDGHSGVQVAQIIQDELEQRFAGYLTQCRGDVSHALKLTIAYFVDRCQRYVEGSTLSLVYLPQPKQDDMAEIYTAVIGDSPVLICDKQNRLCTSVEHNVAVNNLDANAIRDNNRELYDRGELTLSADFVGLGIRFIQLTRSIGDRDFEGILFRHADIQCHRISTPFTLVLASDGVLFNSQRQQIYNRLMQLAGNESADAESLARWVLEHGAYDNVTVILYKSNG